jgi:Yip1 domain
VPENQEHEKEETDLMIWHFATRQDLNLKKMASRMLKAARLDGNIFRELRNDPSTTVQSVSIVAIIGLCYGAGLGFFGFFVGGISLLNTLTITLVGLFSGIIIAFVWSSTTFLIVTKLFRRTISYWGLTRPFFFSWAPGLLFILMSSPIPIISEIIRAAGTTWIAVASVFAIKHAAGLTAQQSMLTFIISIIVLILIQSLVAMT